MKKNVMARHAARMMERRDACSIVMGDHLEDSCVDGRITLKWIFKFGWLGGGMD